VLNSVVGQPTVVNSIFWNNGGDATEEVYSVGAGPRFRHSLVRGSGGSDNWNSDYGVDQGGNLDLSPEFTGLSANELRLRGASPVIDAGSEETEIQRYDTSDLADNPRVVDGDGDGNVIIDMGAYEYQP